MKKVLMMCLLTLFLLGCQTPEKNEVEVEDLLQLNPEIQTGSLENGITYYIKENQKPENRIELRLVVRAGSMQETEKQLGLAHFVEHMAFNGTKNFEKDKLVKYLESIGMAFGPEINAYTSFDETVYKLSIPADDREILDNAFQILEDWAHQISFDDEEIEKERGVIVEEWRLGRGVNGRYRDILLPALLEDSRYANRLPIGDMDVVQYCDPQELRDYYNTWYRPELMSLVVVGSLDPTLIEEKITEHFSFTNKYDIEEKEDNSVPVKDRTVVKVIPDPEQTYNLINYFLMREGSSVITEESYKDLIKDFIGIMMFNSRMEEIYTKPDAPFMYAGGGFSEFVKPVDLTSFSVQVTDGKYLDGFQALLEEIEKVKQFGFIDAEFNRGKKLVTMILENQYNERENIENGTISSELVDYIVGGSTPLGIVAEYKLALQVLDELTLEEVNQRVITNYSSLDRVVTVQMPEIEGGTYPEESELLALFSTVQELTYEEREEEILDSSFFNLSLTPGSVTDKQEFPNSGITQLTLSNGINVYLKPTDFKEDEILLSAVSYGGFSHVEDDEYVSGILTPSLVQSSGVNGYDINELNKVLTGRNLGVNPWISDRGEGFSGSSSVKDFEGMLQLLHLYVVKPEFNQEIYRVMLTNVDNYLQNKDNSPEVVYNERVTELLGDGHFRHQPLNVDSLNDVSIEEMTEIYTERFADMNDFNFIITGSFDTETIIPLLEKYLATLPVVEGDEETKDLGIRPKKGVVKEVISKGIEEKSRVKVIFSGEFTGAEEDLLSMELLANYMEEQLRVLLREDMGGTYGVGVSSNINLYPNREYFFTYTFGCEPGREEELITAASNLIESLKSGEFDQDSLDAVKTNYTRSMELNLKENSYWSSIITYGVENGFDLEKIRDLDASFVTGEKFVQLVNNYLDRENYIQVILQPE